ncbi:hypothetical protein [Desulfofalx alkaliphila]|uniref:hypothetical protein n=1 Tax=Desulfofalx alkaliphila TaxID=105483 RepID=UPI0004E13CAF|nr:hypothetical protein [Desulfofalx alkaliphila]
MLDFQKREKKYFELKLHDGTPLSLPTPTLKLMGRLEATKNVDGMDFQEVSTLVRDVLDTNRQGVKITDACIQKFDFEDMLDLLIGYVEFTRGVLADPNLKSLITQAKVMRE